MVAWIHFPNWQFYCLGHQALRNFEPSHHVDSSSAVRSQWPQFGSLTHCCLVILFGIIDLGQFWLHWQLFALWHQVITWNNVDKSHDIILMVQCKTAVWPVHTSDSYQIPSQNKTKSKLQILKNCLAKNSNFEILQETLHATHLPKLLDKMYKSEMNPTRTVGATERTQNAGRTDRRTDGVKPIYRPTTSLYN